jgi:hypothetical protein
MKFDYYTYQIGGHYLSALMNGDYSGLDDQESQQVDAFLNNLPVNKGHFDVMDLDNSSFSICEVCGLYSETYEVRLYFPLMEGAA